MTPAADTAAAQVHLSTFRMQNCIALKTMTQLAETELTKLGEKSHCRERTFLAVSVLTALAAGLGEVPALSSSAAAASGAAALIVVLGGGIAPFSTLMSPTPGVNVNDRLMIAVTVRLI